MVSFHDSMLAKLQKEIVEDSRKFNAFCKAEDMTKQAKSAFKSKIMKGNYHELNLSKLLDVYGYKVVKKGRSTE